MKPSKKSCGKACRKIWIAPSLLSADFSRLAEEIRDVEKAGCDAVHVDVMDGHFVPNLTIGPVVVRSIRKVTRLPMDVHLMIDEPLRYVAEFQKAGADWLTVHLEGMSDICQTLRTLRKLKVKSGLSLRPKTAVQKLLPYLKSVDLILIMTVEPGFGGQAFMPAMIEKVRWLRTRFSGLISVDGGITPETACLARGAGADILVAGTSVFGASDRARAIKALRGGR